MVSTAMTYLDHEDDGDFEYSATFEGPCTCLDNCPAKGDSEKHGWGSCDDPSEVGCECDAGWCE